MKKWLIFGFVGIVVILLGIVSIIFIGNSSKTNICGIEYIDEIGKITIVQGKLSQSKDGLYIGPLKLEDSEYTQPRFDELRSEVYADVEAKGLLKKVPSGLGYIPGGQVRIDACEERIVLTNIEYIRRVNSSS
ncbi:hypothetical protein FJZ17_02860 [Candidatus Pacearchaeota archaeon]|nr:hypothetical protein [Candidatus Pacearchaeota archaeon]